MLNIPAPNPLKNYKNIIKEITKYGKGLEKKKQVLIISKADLVSKEELKVIVKNIEEYSKSSVLVSSSINKIGLNELIDVLFTKLEKLDNEKNNKETKEKKWSP